MAKEVCSTPYIKIIVVKAVEVMVKVVEVVVKVVVEIISPEGASLGIRHKKKLIIIIKKPGPRFPSPKQALFRRALPVLDPQCLY